MPIPPGTPDLDLTEAGSFGSIGGAAYLSGQTQPAGSGNFNSFVQLQNNGSEQGYNTDASAQYDEKNSHNHNHSILLAEVPIVIGDGTGGTAEGVAYREFRLDLNEPNGGTKRFISLDSLQIWQNEAGNLTNFTSGSGFAGSHTNYLAYDLDAGGDQWIALTDGNSSGSGQSDYRILIPDSYFINDAAHRYVTLYSQFGLQPGWDSGGGFEEWGTSGANGGQVSAFSIQKTATVPGGTADTVGEVISFAIAVSNTGNTALTGITVSDPLVTDLAAVDANFDGFNDGDTNLDNKLSAGETWQYAGTYTLTQQDIDTDGGGDGLIDNTATADSNETGPLSASANIEVEQQPTLELVKTPNVVFVDSAGDQITYTIEVTNNGNVAQTGLVVTDTQVNIVTPILNPAAPILGPELLAPVLIGDYNAGDTNENGIEDFGEMFQYANPGDTNQNGVEDDGETFILTNVGDTNQNGAEDPGEVFQYRNAGDTNQDGVENDGETFQFEVNNLATPVDVDEDGLNDGDANFDGQINPGETWQYTVAYTVTQDDIDNGGVVDPGLTHNNTATATSSGPTVDGSAFVPIVQDPRVTIDKSAEVEDGAADEAGDIINYTIVLANAGNMTLTDVVVTDPSVSDLTYVSGDTDNDGKLDLTEMWTYTASHTLTQDEIDNGGVVDPGLTRDNTATVTTAQSEQEIDGDPDATASDSESVVVVQDPRVTIDKSAEVEDGAADEAGDIINYTIVLANAGNMTLTDVVVADPSVSDLTYVSGDDDNDGKLDLTESWTYTASHTLTQEEIDNGGVVATPGPLTISNTATVTTAQSEQEIDGDPNATASDSASVTIVQDPHVTLTKNASVPGNTANVVGEAISYTITIHNDGNMTLTGVSVTDPSVTDLAADESGGFNVGDSDMDGVFDVGELWAYTASHTVTQADIDDNGGGDGTIDNTASVATDQGAMSSDIASIPVARNPAMTLVKAALGYHDENGNEVADAGDLIDFSFTINNVGNATLHSIDVADLDGAVMVAGTSIPSLAPGDSNSINWSGSYEIQQLDVDNGFYENTAVTISLEAGASSGTLHTVLADLLLIV